MAAEGMWSVGRLSEALRYAQKGYEMDPVNPIRSLFLGCTSMANGLYDEAVLHIDRARELGLYDALVWMCGLHARLEAQEFDAAESWFAESPIDMPNEMSVVQQAYFAARRNPTSQNVRKAVDVITDALDDKNRPRIMNQFAPWMLATMGAVDAAYELYESGTGMAMNLWWLPSLSAYRRDSRFIGVVERFGVPGVWRQFGWPEACQPTGDRFVCE